MAENDWVYIVYTDMCKNITLDFFELAKSKQINIIPLKANAGSKNALDFQLSSYLGYVIGKNNKPSDKYYIVSKDEGYDRVCEFWIERGVVVKRIPSLTSKQKNKNSQTKKQSDIEKSQIKKKSTSKDVDIATEEEILKYLSKEESSTAILDIFNQNKTKVEIHNKLDKHIEHSKKPREIYQKLKPLIKQKNKS